MIFSEVSRLAGALQFYNKYITEFYYDERGAQSRIKNGSTEIYQGFDAIGKLTSQTVLGSGKLDLKNSYLPNGQAQTYSEGSTAHTFGYDFAKRLTSWNNGTSTITYDYDKAGNLKNPHGLNLTFNEANEIIGYLYDDAGNLTQDNKYIYTWDQQGQLTSVKDLSNNVIASYTYNPDGLRKSKTVGSTTYNYHYDGTNLVRITNNSGATVWSFTWANGKPVSMTNSSGTTYYYVTNFRGDVIRIMDGNGTSVASYSYDPWGKVLTATEDPAVTGQPIRYASYVYDTETQLYYLQARYYDPETARFISRDSDGGDQNNPLSQNLYAYANDDPVNNVDADGHFAWSFAALTFPTIGELAAGIASAVTGVAEAALAVTAITLASYAIYKAVDSIYTSTRSADPPAKRLRFPSKKSAYDAAKRAGNGAEPNHHPYGKYGPHYHPNIPKSKGPRTRNAPNAHDHYYYPKVRR